MTRRGLLDWPEGVALTPAGAHWLDGLDIEIKARNGRPAFGPAWT
jgi:hypothetical protein